MVVPAVKLIVYVTPVALGLEVETVIFRDVTWAASAGVLVNKAGAILVSTTINDRSKAVANFLERLAASNKSSFWVWFMVLY